MSRNDSPNRNIFQKLIKINKINEDEWFNESESLKYGVIIFIDDLKLFKLLHSYIFMWKSIN